MTAKEIQKRNQKSEQLKVLQSEDGQYFVESGEGKILYNVTLDDKGDSCTCGDFAKNVKKDPNFKCKHILAVYNAIPKKQVEGACFLEKHEPKLDERFITNIKGKDFVLYAGVLDLATQRGLLKLEVELIQFPSKENGNEAICRAVAEGKNGDVFSDIGDANPSNCASMIAKHLIRMASTRAKARCLRDMCNIGICTVEELADFDEVISAPDGKRASKAQPKDTGKSTQKAPKAKATEKAKQSKRSESNGPSDKAPKSEPKDPPDQTGQPKMSEAQRRAIFNLSRRRGISVDEIECMVEESYGVALANLTAKDASSFIRNLQQAA